MATSSKPIAKPVQYAGQITFKLPERLPPWPEKKSRDNSEADEMFAKLVCSPPLGQATVVPSGQSTTFTVLLETDAGSKKEWQVALWHNAGASDHEWVSLDLKAASDDIGIVCFDSIQLSFPHAYSF
jgi:hypothetical protein